MPFSFGLHPAFRTPQYENENWEDYSIRFDPQSDAEQIVFTPELDPVKYEKVHLDQWNLSREDIDKYATIVYQNYDFDTVYLTCSGEDRIKVTFPNFPFLAFWSHPSRPHFICIEPWFGHADFEKVPDDFYHRDGTLVIKPNQTFKAGYSITLCN